VRCLTRQWINDDDLPPTGHPTPVKREPDFVAASGCVYDADTGRLEVVIADPVSRIPMFATTSAV
jgi:hypothetical protein